MRRLGRIAILGALAALFEPAAAPVGAAEEDLAAQVVLGERLAAVLRAGRTVVSNSQDLINDPDTADKGLTGGVFRGLVVETYTETHGEPPLTDALTPLQRQLTGTQLDAMTEIIDENQPIINAEGLAFKGFIPAVFARLVNEEFAARIGSVATVKVTAPMNLVRNRLARPDDWEDTLFETRLKDAAWPRGEAIYEDTTVGGKPAFRMLIPEYYSSSCLVCHGQPQGEMDITGFPKEGAEEGDLAGAISITLFK